MLDVAGYPDCDIMASNSLDEHLISDMVSQGAKVDYFIVGERLITSASSPLFGGVYKLSAIEKDGKTVPKINLSENVRKITIPSSKQVYRLIREYCLRQTDTLWDEVKRFENPHKYYVDLSKNLWAERNGLIEKFKGIK